MENREITNKILKAAALVMSYVVFIIGAVWMVVSFALHLFKDEPFYWASIWLTAIGFFSLLFFFIKMSLSYKVNKLND